MKNSRQFLIISLIVHLLVFIILACIVLPPTGRFREFLDSLYVDFVEVEPIRITIPREKSPVEEKVEQEEEAELVQTPKPPEPEAFTLSMDEPANDGIRAISSEKTISQGTPPEKKGMASAKPLALELVPRVTDDENITAISGLQQNEGSLAGSSGSMGFSGSEVGPIGSRSGTKGASDQYLYPGGLARQRKEGDKFSEILPELAGGILKRATRKKMDIVFVIDTTGSMRDNVRGVKDYIEYFLEPIEDKGFDAALGLVKFTDVSMRKTEVVGLTQSQKKFRKWLDKTVFLGGGDIPESGYEALIATLEEIDFRDDAQKFFIFISDATQHDLDYDGKSRYTLDRIVARLNDEGVSMDVVGTKYLAVKQLAWGTGGQWKHIPGGDPLTDSPRPVTTMIKSRLERSLLPVLVEDKVTVEYNQSVPNWVDLSYKMLDPLGFKVLGTLTYRKKISNKTQKKVEFFPRIDFRKFRDNPGIYTLIYRVRDSIGNWDILRRTLELNSEDS